MDKEMLEKLESLGWSIDSLESVGTKVRETNRWDCTHKDLLDKTIVILGYHPIETGYGGAFLAHCIVDNEERNVLLGGAVLQKQLEEVWNGKPMLAKIRKVGRYYSFVE